MNRLVSKIKPGAQIAASVVLVAFGILGITNATHAAAKVVYAVLIVVGLLLVTSGIIRTRQTSKPEGDEHRDPE